MKTLPASLLCLAMLGCKENIDEFFPPPPPIQLPPETQLGANTFGCALNGQVWEGSSHGSIRPFLYASPDASYSRGVLQLSAGARTELKSPISGFRFYLGGLRQLGTYYLSKPPSRNASAYGYAEAIGSNYPLADYYSTDSLRTGTITITRLDTLSVRKFVSGRFEMTARPKNGGVVTAGFPTEIIVSQGRFDVELNRP